MSLESDVKNELKVTAFGKTVKVAVWIVAGYAVTMAISYFANYHWTASLVALGVPSAVNLLLYGLSQFFDGTVPNFPGSSPLVSPAPSSASVNTGGVANPQS